VFDLSGFEVLLLQCCSPPECIAVVGVSVCACVRVSASPGMSCPASSDAFGPASALIDAGVCWGVLHVRAVAGNAYRQG